MPVERKVVEQVAKIDVELIAERNHRGEADAPACRPFDKPGGDGARLRHQREIAALRAARGKAGVEMGARNHHAETVGTDDA